MDASLDEYQSRIAERMERGGSVDDVDEEIIGPSPFTNEQKAALWLYAWSYVPPARQRYEARRLGVQVPVPTPVFAGD